MDERCKQYHSALSRCAELLDNMKDGDPITEVPQFLAAKLKQCQLAGAARQGGNTSIEELTRYDGFCSYDGGGPAEMEVSEDGQYVKFDDVAAYLAGQSQATRAAPEGWNVRRINVSGSHRIIIESDKQMRSITSDGEPTLFRFFSDLLVAAPAAQEVTQQAAPDDEDAPSERMLFEDAFPEAEEEWSIEADQVAWKVWQKARESIVPSTQQAAKAETAERALDDAENAIDKVMSDADDSGESAEAVGAYRCLSAIQALRAAKGGQHG